MGLFDELAEGTMFGKKAVGRPNPYQSGGLGASPQPTQQAQGVPPMSTAEYANIANAPFNPMTQVAGQPRQGYHSWEQTAARARAGREQDMSWAKSQGLSYARQLGQAAGISPAEQRYARSVSTPGMGMANAQAFGQLSAGIADRSRPGAVSTQLMNRAPWGQKPRSRGDQQVDKAVKRIAAQLGGGGYSDMMPGLDQMSGNPNYADDMSIYPQAPVSPTSAIPQYEPEYTASRVSPFDAAQRRLETADLSQREYDDLNAELYGITSTRAGGSQVADDRSTTSWENDLAQLDNPNLTQRQYDEINDRLYKDPRRGAVKAAYKRRRWK